MQIIDEVEPQKRGPYAGAVGYIDFTGNMDTCIALRTLVLQGKHAYVQAGGGVVYDSVPADEYEETVNKARRCSRRSRLRRRSCSPNSVGHALCLQSSYLSVVKHSNRE